MNDTEKMGEDQQLLYKEKFLFTSVAYSIIIIIIYYLCRRKVAQKKTTKYITTCFTLKFKYLYV